MDQSLETPETLGAGEADGKQTQCHGKSEERKTEGLIAEIIRQQESIEQLSEIDAVAAHNVAEVGDGASFSKMDNLPLKHIEMTEAEMDSCKKKLDIDSNKPDSENADSNGNALRSENTKAVDIVTPFENESEKSDQYSNEFENKLEQLENNFSELENEVLNKPAFHTEDKNKKLTILAEEPCGHKLEAESVTAVAVVKERNIDSIISEPEQNSTVTVAAGNKLEKAGLVQQIQGEHQEKTDEGNRHLGLSKEADPQVPVSLKSNLKMEQNEKKKKIDQKKVASGPKEKQVEQPLSKYKEKKQRKEKHRQRSSRSSKQQYKHSSSNQGYTSISPSTSVAEAESEEDDTESDGEEGVDSNSHQESSVSENYHLSDNLKGSQSKNIRTVLYMRDAASTVDKNGKCVEECRKATSNDTSDEQPRKENEHGNPLDDGHVNCAPVKTAPSSEGDHGNVDSSTSGNISQEQKKASKNLKKLYIAVWN